MATEIKCKTDEIRDYQKAYRTLHAEKLAVQYRRLASAIFQLQNSSVSYAASVFQAATT